jgi:hypothetical protein
VIEQLELFHGPHVPLLAALAALERGHLGAAREALGSTEDPAARVDAERLAAIDAAPSSVEQVHAQFESALAERIGAPSAIGQPTWWRLYAGQVATALASDPSRRFRGWCGIHYALATGTGRPDAGPLVASSRAPWAWLEASRAAWAAGEPERARRWLAVACLRDDQGIAPDPPPIAPSLLPPLNPPADALPRLPTEIEDLWTEAADLNLPGPPSSWVPVLLIIDGKLSASLLGWNAELAGSGFDPAGTAPPEEPAPRAFLRALLRAREARSADLSSGPGRYGATEVAARQRMRQVAPALLERYLTRLGGGTPARQPT